MFPPTHRASVTFAATVAKVEPPGAHGLAEGRDCRLVFDLSGDGKQIDDADLELRCNDQLVLRKDRVDCNVWQSGRDASFRYQVVCGRELLSKGGAWGGVSTPSKRARFWWNGSRDLSPSEGGYWDIELAVKP